MNTPNELQKIYGSRFEGRQEYRNCVWKTLLNGFFQKYIQPSASVLDLGCGYGEFINNVQCGRKFAMDLNPTAKEMLAREITFFQQDCSTTWPLPENSLDVVFTSNFFEHLPSKDVLGATLEQAQRCLKPGGKLIALGPNIKYLPGAYWDFWDHYLPLTELSLSEGLRNRGFDVVTCHPRFLPYTMVGAPQYPTIFLAAYLRLPIAWRWFGGQFLIVAEKVGRS